MAVAEITAQKDEVHINRLAGALGAELRGLNLASLTANGLATLNKALIEHHVVAVRDQKLTPGELHAFTQMLGPTHAYQAAAKSMGHPGFPDIIRLVNTGYAKAVTHYWHSEASAWPAPPSFTILSAQILPSAGGDTMFANQHLALETLSPALQQMLSSMRAHHSVAYQSGTGSEAVHPVVRTHPVTGRRALYVNRYFTKHFEGMSVEESRPLLAYFEAHSVRDELVYRHRWELGDVVIWDNRSVQHRATQDYGDEDRLMFHVEVKDEIPA